MVQASISSGHTGCQMSPQWKTRPLHLGHKFWKWIKPIEERIIKAKKKKVCCVQRKGSSIKATADSSRTDNVPSGKWDVRCHPEVCIQQQQVCAIVYIKSTFKFAGSTEHLAEKLTEISLLLAEKFHVTYNTRNMTIIEVTKDWISITLHSCPNIVLVQKCGVTCFNNLWESYVVL